MSIFEIHFIDLQSVSVLESTLPVMLCYVMLLFGNKNPFRDPWNHIAWLFVSKKAEIFIDFIWSVPCLYLVINISWSHCHKYWFSVPICPQIVPLTLIESLLWFERSRGVWAKVWNSHIKIWKCIDCRITCHRPFLEKNFFLRLVRVCNR